MAGSVSGARETELRVSVTLSGENGNIWAHDDEICLLCDVTTCRIFSYNSKKVILYKDE